MGHTASQSISRPDGSGESEELAQYCESKRRKLKVGKGMNWQ
ncbi:hypothetical protein [Escherichia albertii]|nr:hypothetical protein [Escherichia albertii]WDB34356.1 hypothetical protein PS032_00240 [Escherichia albertii]